ncbi:MAG: DNA polymerase III subunit gamma/tau, partial [Bdellovibrionales bacterium]|nr:DNA polymerase III subunit gamma/tau [Bdellovibrionales bacterium]
QTFNELIGQEHVTQTLHNALKNDRLPHALLFTGTRGVGKTSAARILAKSLRCPNAVDFVPCNKCSVCQDISVGSSIDVLEIDGASNNGVEAVRELIEKVGYMPSSGKYKIYIIDEVHMLSTSAFNALLKTLEEPPAHVKFVFATTEVHKIPSTILSRCQRFDFRRIPTRMIRDHLTKICETEGIGFETEALWSVARQGDGSMRDSQSLLDQVITFSGDKITQRNVIDVLGLTDRAMIVDTLGALINRDGEQALSIVERIYQSGQDAKIFVGELLEEIRHLLFVKEAPDRAATFVDLPDSEIEVLKTYSEAVEREEIHMLFDMTLKGAQEIPRADDPRLVLEMLVLKMVNAPQIVQLKQILTGSGEPSKKNISGPAKVVNRVSKPAVVPPARVEAAAPPEPPKPVEPKPVVKRDLNEKEWVLFVAVMRKVDSRIGAQLENLSLSKIEGTKIELGLKKQKEFLIKQIESEETMKALHEQAKMYFAHDFEFKVTIVDNEVETMTPRDHSDRVEHDRKSALREEVENHPLVKQITNVMNAKIKEIKETKS